VHAVHLTPSCQVPTGTVFSLDRKERLVKWAGDSKAWLIEDDFGGDLNHRRAPPPSVYSMDRLARTLYLGSFAVSMFPGVKLAYLVVPSSLVPQFRKIASLEGITCPLVIQAAMAEFIDCGDFARHLRRMCKLYDERMETLRSILHEEGWPKEKVWAPHCGVNLVLHLNVEDVPITRKLAKENIRVEPLSRYYISNAKQGIVAGFGHMNHDELSHHGRHLIQELRSRMI
jgi:GntR family transcriptional regulator/MocR family aminotransferase